MNPELYPVRRFDPSAALVASYALDWRAQFDAELVQAMADEQMSALAEVMADEHTVASARALTDEVVRRGLRAAVSAEVERRHAMTPASVVEIGADDIPF